MKKSDSVRTNKRTRVQLSFKDSPSLTEQTHKDSCNINNIIKKYDHTGILPSNVHQNLAYGYAPDMDLKEALDTAFEHGKNFHDLPPEIQEKFGNDSGQYFDFLDEYDRAPESFYESSESESDTVVSKNEKVAEKAASGSSDGVEGSET